MIVKYNNTVCFDGNALDFDAKSIVNMLIENGFNDATESDLVIKKSNEESFKDIENHIYSKYSEKKQAQDQVWAMSFRTKLVGLGFENIEKEVIAKAKKVIQGTELDKVVENVEPANQPMFKKLVKIAIKTNWAESVINEGKLAIMESREPVFPDFPTI